MTQERALEILKTGANVFLTGEPGAGKTYVINAYIQYLHSCGIEPAVTASTGIAATHVSGMTIHSWSGIGVKSVVTDYDLDAIEQKEKVARRVRLAHVLIIDEVSMLSADLLDSLDAVCRHLRRSSRPFGGLQVIVVGDFFQLPPVTKRGEPQWRFAFRAAVWKRATFITCYLHEQHRQEDRRFLKTLAAIRRGHEVGRARATLRERQMEDVPEQDITRLFPHNINVDEVNDMRLQGLKGSVRTFYMNSSGAPPLIEGLKRSCLSPETLFLKEGAKVMFTKNDPSGEYVNGTQGEVVEFNPISRNPVVKMLRGRTLEVGAVEWQVADGARVLAKITQVPLRLAWAITVHKSQGMSLDAAVIDLGEAFEYGQGYVALSRVRTLAGLYLLGLNERALEVHPEVSAQDEEFRAASEAADHAFGNMSRSELAQLQQNFIRASGGSMGKGRAAPKTKAPKGSTFEATRELLAQKMSLEEIAKERNLTVGTIIGHLEKLKSLKKLDPHRDLDHLAFDPDRMEDMKRAFKKVSKKGGEVSLTSAIRHLDSSYSFDELKLARLFLA